MDPIPYSVWRTPSGAAVVTMPGHIDDAHCAHVRAPLMRAVRSRAAIIIADLTRTGSCGYSAAETLISVQARAAEAGARLKVAAAGGKALLIGQIAGPGHQIDFYPDLEAALADPRTGGTARGTTATGRKLRLIPGRSAASGPGKSADRPPAASPPDQAPPPGPSPAPA